MGIVISFQKKFWKCTECGTVMPIEAPHKCANIRLRKFINKRIFQATARNTLICGLLTSLVFLAFLLYLYRDELKYRAETQTLLVENIKSMSRTTGVLLDSQIQLNIERGWKPSEMFYSWANSLTNER